MNFDKTTKPRPAVATALPAPVGTSFAHENSVEVQLALFKITELSASAEEVNAELFRAIHNIIKELMYAANFFVVLADDADPDWVDFPYFCDTVDTDWTRRTPKQQFLESLTGYVFRQGEALLASGEEIAAMQTQGLFRVRGAMMVDWLGVPLKQGENIFGAIVVQSYDENIRYGEADKNLLTFVSRHVAIVISRKRAERALQRLNENLEQRVQERTRELEHRERLQAALYRIADLSHSGHSLEQMYAEIHRIISGLIYADNFFIALLNSDRDTINYPYFVDSIDPIDSFQPRALRAADGGLTDYLIRECKPLLVSKTKPLPANLNIVGAVPYAWLGVPLLWDGEAVGAIAVQSYNEAISFTEHDKELLTYVSKHISAALKRKRDSDLLTEAHRALQRTNDKLEQRVKERTQELSNTNAVLKSLLQEKDDAVALQGALYKIADVTASAKTMQELYAGIHGIIGDLMYADNFYIALYDDEARERIGFPYFVDTLDTLKITDSLPAMEFMNSTLTGYVLKTGEPLFASGDEIRQMQEAGVIHMVGQRMVEWLGVPLKLGDEVLGVMVVQSYLEDRRYQPKDRELLLYVSQHIATAVTRKRAEQAIKRGKDELEKRVEQRTQELIAANLDLENQIKERERAEKLQAALYRIADLSSSADNLSEFYKSLHDIVSELMYAENFYVAVVDVESNMLTFPYFVDQTDDGFEARPLNLANPKQRRGLTEEVLLRKEPLLISTGDGSTESLKYFGQDAHSWLGVPLINDEEAVGALVVQTYSADVVFTEKEKELLSFVSQHISTALKRKKDSDLLLRAHKELQQVNDELEKRVIERTSALEAAQKELLESAHRSGMSEIATGVLHNVGNLLNSIATSVDALGHLQRNSRLETLSKANDLIQQHRGNLVDFLVQDPRGQKVLPLYEKITEHLMQREVQIQEQVVVIQKCSRVIAEVISTQQKYAKGSLYKEEVRLAELVEDALAMKASLLLRNSIRVDKDFTSVPHLWLEKAKILNVLINLIKNATEAMEQKPVAERLLFLRIYSHENAVVLEVKDHGCGIKPEHLNKIFNHGFTTKDTGHGFGLHSCANAMKENGGIITAHSEGEGHGATFVLRFELEEV